MIVWLAGPTSSAPLATVTTPVVLLMANRPPALLVKLYTTGGPLGSVEEAVMPTKVPLAAPSATLFADPLTSTGVEGFALVTLMVKSALDVPPPHWHWLGP